MVTTGGGGLGHAAALLEGQGVDQAGMVGLLSEVTVCKRTETTGTSEISIRTIRNEHFWRVATRGMSTAGAFRFCPNPRI